MIKSANLHWKSKGSKAIPTHSKKYHSEMPGTFDTGVFFCLDKSFNISFTYQRGFYNRKVSTQVNK